MFSKYIINFENLFDELLKSTEFEDITNGRKGAILVDYKNDLIPIVRTTTNYNKSVQKFLSIHHKIIDNIKEVSNNHKLEFNNAMIEVYDSTYRTMGYHTDQALDLADDSYICIFSCYSDNSTVDIRKLKLKNKITGECSEILLEHNSLVLFPVSTNGKYLHKIVLENMHMKDKKWLGITFRLSKTFINFVNDSSEIAVPYFYPSNIVLSLANEKEKQEFMKHKSSENLNIDYIYPDIHYTISLSDMMSIK